jgi:hypothetical protein
MPLETYSFATPLSTEELERFYESNPNAQSFEWRTAPGAPAEIYQWQPGQPRAFTFKQFENGEWKELEGRIAELQGKLGEWQGEGAVARAYALGGEAGLHAFVLGGGELSAEQKALIEKEVAQALGGVDLQGINDDVLKELGQHEGMSPEALAEIEGSLSQAMQGINLRELELEGLAQAMPSLNMSEDQLAELENKINRLLEEVLPRLEERLEQLELELGADGESVEEVIEKVTVEERIVEETAAASSHNS